MSRIVRLVHAPAEPGLRRGGFVAPLVAAVVLTTSIAAAAVSLNNVAPPAHFSPPQVDYAALVKQYDPQRAELVAVLEAAGIGAETMVRVLEEGGASQETLDAVHRAMKHEQLVREKVEPIVVEVRAALDAGAITEEQAHDRLAELHAAVVKEYRHDLRNRRSEELRKQHDLMAAKLRHAIAEGRITEEQAREKMMSFVADLKRKLEPELQAKARHQDELAEVKRLSEGIKIAYEAGKITRAEAAAKLDELHEHAIALQAQLEQEQAIRADAQVKQARAHLAQRAADLKAAYKAGEMTREQVDQSLRQMEVEVAREMSKSRRK
jgi:hypothetical protein